VSGADRQSLPVPLLSNLPYEEFLVVAQRDAAFHLGIEMKVEPTLEVLWETKAELDSGNYISGFRHFSNVL